MKALSDQICRRALRKSQWLVKNVNELPLVFSPLLSQFSQLTHAFSTRLGGETEPPMHSFNVGRISTWPNSRHDLMKNRAKLCSALGLSYENLVVPNMSHSDLVVFLDKWSAHPFADGLATNKAGLPLMLTFADCVPIVIFDPVNNTLALVHAGWRGTASQIVCKAVKVLETLNGSSASQMVAAIGPAIGSCCYPTGLVPAYQLLGSISANFTSLSAREPDAYSFDALSALVSQLELAELFPIKTRQFHPDLKAVNAMQLLACGLAEVDVTDICTSCNPETFYSHRQSGGQAGRQGAVACLN